MTAAPRFWRDLPPVRGFQRVSDGPNGQRRLRCDRCGDVIASSAVGGHEQGRPCDVRKAEREARSTR